jgi:hypothetical protein
MITKNYIAQNIRIMNNLRLRSKKVIERNGSDCKYVGTLIHHVGSIGAPNRRTVFNNNINNNNIKTNKTNSCDFSPQANYTDPATAVCRRS